MSDTPPVIDDEEKHRLEVTIDGHLAELVYRVGDGRLVLVHTGVPDELGGQGIGSVLVQAAVAKAVAEDLTIVPNCPFARSWLERHPDEAAAARIEWPTD
jgi:predicted GNAT family acetyltransferase